MYWILQTQNYMTTDYYFEILKEAIELKGQQVRYLTNFDECEYNDTILVGSVLDGMKMICRGFKNIIIWVQGIAPEESFLRNGNYAKKFILELIEQFVLHRVKFIIFVSQEMKQHYEKKYNISINSFIMPCFNTDINKKSFFSKCKYQNNVFCYVGSLYVWQCFNETIYLYKRIEKKNDVKLLVCTPDTEKAKQIIYNNNIKNYDIKFVSKDKLNEELKKVKFGFVIREDNAVNRVSTPTKLSTYLANGIIPIYSHCIVDFSKIMNDSKFAISLVERDVTKIEKMLNMHIDPKEIFDEYNNIFNSYYCKEKYVKELSKVI